MGRNNFFDKLMLGVDLPTETTAKHTLVEIVDFKRVIIENHLGITLYEKESICVNQKLGNITIIGTDLHINKMSKEQLVVIGKIEIYLF